MFEDKQRVKKTPEQTNTNAGIVTKKEENYFVNHSDETLAKLCLEQLQYIKMKKGAFSARNDKDHPFFQDLQAEVINRFVTKYKAGTL